MNEKSIWIDKVEIKDYPILDKDLDTDVLIIGGGITGILCAYEFKQRNIDYVLIEKDKIGRGTSKDTTAFLTAQHETLYQDLIKNKGKQKAKEYLEINLKALDRYKELSKVYNFDYKECKSYLYSRVSKNIILKEKDALDSLEYKTEITYKLPIDVDVEAGILFLNQATIHPLKFISEISNDLDNIYEHTMVNKLKGNIAYTANNHKIKFKKVIMATHYPIRNKGGLYFAKITQRRSYVVAIENEDIKDTFCSVDENGMYFRSHDKYLIIGGNDRDSKKVCKREFFEKVKDLIKGKKIEYSWSGQDCITLDGIPYIGKYSSLNDNYYIATGFNLWGFTWAMASSFILADLIENKKEYPLVDPRRFFINKNLFINVATAIKNLVSFRSPRCKHLGCALNYNKLEDTWECPCHGSRYDNNGKVIDGPALRNLKN